MTHELDEPSEYLRDLHETVIRFLEREGIVLKQPNIWSYCGPSAKPYVDDIVLEFFHVASAHNHARSLFANECRVAAQRAVDAVDLLLPHLDPVLRMVDQVSGVEFTPGSTFALRSVEDIKLVAPSIHRTTARGAEFRLGLVELLGMLSIFIPSEAKIGLREEQLSTYYAYRLDKAGMPVELIADVIGLFDKISPRLPESERLDERDTKVEMLRQRLSRFSRSLRK